MADQVRSVRILKTYGGKVKQPWGIFDSLTNENLGVGSMSQCIHKVEQLGWILKSDYPSILGSIPVGLYSKGPAVVPRPENRDKDMSKYT